MTCPRCYGFDPFCARCEGEGYICETCGQPQSWCECKDEDDWDDENDDWGQFAT